MEEFELRFQIYNDITFDWVLGDIRPLIVRTVYTTVRKVVCCMYLRHLPQHMTSLIQKTLIIIVTAVWTSNITRLVKSSHVKIVWRSLI